MEGDGTIQGVVSVSNGATITGGDGLTIPGKLTAPPTINGTLNVYLNGTNAGTTYDQIATTGSSPVVLGANSDLTIALGIGFTSSVPAHWDAVRYPVQFDRRGDFRHV